MAPLSFHSPLESGIGIGVVQKDYFSFQIMLFNKRNDPSFQFVREIKLTKTKWTPWFWYCEYSFSNAGNSFTQGWHQVAQS